MSALSPTGAADTSATPAATGESERVRLARVALAAALSLPGVVRGDSGPLRAHRTPVEGAAPLDGVICAATAHGGYAIALRLIASLVPLPALAERVVGRVTEAARESEPASALEEVSVHFADIEMGHATR